MTFPVHFPDKKTHDKFRSLLKEAKYLNGMSYYRTLMLAVTNLLIKLRKENLQ